MKKSIPIKTELFRFVTFRSPEHLSAQSKSIRFVTHPDIDNSAFKPLLFVNQKASIVNEPSEYTKTFESFKSYHDVRNIKLALYDFANNVTKTRRSIKSFDRENNTELLLSEEEEVTLFDQLIYQVLTKESSYVRQAICQLLVINHVLKFSEELVSIGLAGITDVKIEIPHQVINYLKEWEFKKCSGKLEGVQSLGIADFRKVEQEVCCYVPGEVSHIENVMAKEYKERSTRNYVRTEDTLETTVETEIENLTDVTTATRNEISSEIANVLQEDRSNNYGGSLGVSANYAGAEINVNAYADFATSNASTYSNSEAKTYAEEVTSRALERIVQKTSEKRTSKIIKEFEENNKHGFDNRNGDKHVTGIYRWVDIIYKNRLVNYGKRLMVEFMVPEPAEFYKRILKYKPIAESEPDVTEAEPQSPPSLVDLDIKSHKDITRDNYLSLATEYGITVNAPLDETVTVTQILSPPSSLDGKVDSWTHPSAVVVEPDYEASSIKGSYSFQWRARTGSGYWNCKVGNVTFGKSDLSGWKKETFKKDFDDVLNPPIMGSVPVQVQGNDKIYTYSCTLNITCLLSSEKFEEWQLETYTQLMNAYESANNQYNNDQEEISFDQAAENRETNPEMNRIIEQRELKRICIEMIMKPFCRAQGKRNFIDQNACDKYEIPQVNQTAELSEYASQVKFFEQAIDWKIMSYLFYSYYWADKCDWADLMQNENEDPVFQAFLQSGMSRVVVPIRPQFTIAFLYYLETGDIWLGNDLAPGMDSDLYLSIAEEMQTVEGTVEDEWETRVPTSLAIIQGKSAYLDQEGLPCCHEVENDGATTNIEGADDTLQLMQAE